MCTVLIKLESCIIQEVLLLSLSLCSFVSPSLSEHGFFHLHARMYADRQKDRQTDAQTHRHTDTQIHYDRRIDTKTHRWRNLNLEIISPGSRTRDFTVVNGMNVRFGIHQVCPGVVNSLGTPRRENGRFRYYGEPARQDDVTSPVSLRTRLATQHGRWGNRVKCRTICFYETRSLRSTGSRFWRNLNLEIISPWSRTRDFTVVSRYFYR